MYQMVGGGVRGGGGQHTYIGTCNVRSHQERRSHSRQTTSSSRTAGCRIQSPPRHSSSGRRSRAGVPHVLSHRWSAHRAAAEALAASYHSAPFQEAAIPFSHSRCDERVTNTIVNGRQGAYWAASKRLFGVVPACSAVVGGSLSLVGAFYVRPEPADGSGPPCGASAPAASSSSSSSSASPATRRRRQRSLVGFLRPSFCLSASSSIGLFLRRSPGGTRDGHGAQKRARFAHLPLLRFGELPSDEDHEVDAGGAWLPRAFVGRQAVMESRGRQS